MRTGLLAAAVVGAVCLGGTAQAAKTVDKQGDVNVFLKGGVGSYTGELDDVTAAGPTWGATVNLQPWNVLGFELGYDGSRNALETLGGTAAATRHGGTGMLKLGLPFIERVKPFVGAGLGVSHVSIQGDESAAYRNDIMEEIPLAAGLEFNTGAVTAGVRTTYRILIDEQFASSAVGNADGSLLEAGAALGVRF